MPIIQEGTHYETHYDVASHEVVCHDPFCLKSAVIQPVPGRLETDWLSFIETPVYHPKRHSLTMKCEFDLMPRRPMKLFDHEPFLVKIRRQPSHAGAIGN